MEIVKREKYTHPWYEPILELGKGFTFGLLNYSIALLYCAFCFLSLICSDYIHNYLDLIGAFLYPIMLLGLIGLQLFGIVTSLVDLCSRSTYQDGARATLAVVGLTLNCLPMLICCFTGILV